MYAIAKTPPARLTVTPPGPLYRRISPTNTRITAAAKARRTQSAVGSGQWAVGPHGLAANRMLPAYTAHATGRIPPEAIMRRSSPRSHPDKDRQGDHEPDPWNAPGGNVVQPPQPDQEDRQPDSKKQPPAEHGSPSPV